MGLYFHCLTAAIALGATDASTQYLKLTSFVTSDANKIVEPSRLMAHTLLSALPANTRLSESKELGVPVVCSDPAH